MYSVTINKLTSTLATFLFPKAHTVGTFVIGIVTDTRCGRHHVISEATPSGACARSCVRLGSKYALLAGKDLYVLSDQRTPERFAGQNVRIAGALDMATKTLEIESIRPVSGSVSADTRRPGRRTSSPALHERLRRPPRLLDRERQECSARTGRNANASAACLD